MGPHVRSQLEQKTCTAEATLAADEPFGVIYAENCDREGQR